MTETCQTCGGPTTPDLRIPVAIRAEPDGNKRVTGWFCGAKCQRAELHAVLRSRKPCRNPECREFIDTRDGQPGRPREFCSDGCRKATNRMLNRALVRVAKGERGIPHGVDKLRRAIFEVEHLLRSWHSDARNAIDQGRPGPPPPEGYAVPEPALVRATHRQLTRMHELLNLAIEAKAADDREAADRAANERRAAFLAQRQAADASWRQRILGALRGAMAEQDEARAAAAAAEQQQQHNHQGVY